MSFDNIQWSALTVPPLTTVAQDIKTICKQALNILDSTVINSGGVGEPMELIAPQLIVRGSTAEVAKVNLNASRN